MAPPAPVSPNRLSTASSLSSSTSPRPLSASSSFSSSNSNGRLSPHSQRLSVAVPDNARFLPSLAAAGAGGVGDLPASSLSRSWTASEQELQQDSEGDAEGPAGDEDEWADADDGAENEERGMEGLSAPTTPIMLPGLGSPAAYYDAGEPLAAAAQPLTSAGAAGQAEEAPSIGLGLGVSSLPTGNAEETQRWVPSAPAEGGDMPFPPLSSCAPLPQSHASPPSGPTTRPSLISHAPSSSYTSSRASRQSTATASSAGASVAAASSNASTLSLPTAPPVDLNLPNVRSGGTYVSVANSRMASLAAGNAPQNRNSGNSQPSTARAFFTNLLNRSPRADASSSRSPRFSPSPSPSTSPNPESDSSVPRSPSAPLGWQSQHPSVASLQRSPSNSGVEGPHTRSTSMPQLARMSTEGAPQPRESRDLFRPSVEGGEHQQPQRRTPRALAAATFAGLTRSSSLGGGRSSPPRSQQQQQHQRASPVPTFDFSTPPLASSPHVGGDAAQPAPEKPPSLSGMGLGLVPLTPSVGLGRHGLPLCGALLDDKYLLIGTNTGLDFLPLPLPGALPMHHLGSRKRKETRKPISLIKRTRFKELAVLSERSNILLAIAGRNDHIRVYALDGIRSMIEKKMEDLDIRDGYPYIQDASIFDTKTEAKGKGKGKAPQSQPPSFRPQSSSSTSAFPSPSTFPAPAPAAAPSDLSPSYQFPPSSAPPDYALPAPSPRRRPPSWHQSPFAAPAAPVRISSTSRPPSIVRAVPTNPPTASPSSIPPMLTAPRGSVSSQTTVRPQKSREFIASTRRGSTATINRRRSRADLGAVGASVSRRSSVASHAAVPGEGDVPAIPPLDRRLSVPSTSLSSANGSFVGPGSSSAHSRSRMQPRAPVRPVNPAERSPTSDLADFLRESGPEMHSPEMDHVLASARQRRSNSITDGLLHVAKEAQLFPTCSPGAGLARPSFERAATSDAAHTAGAALYGASADATQGRDELVEMLQGSPEAEGRRALRRDFDRRGSAATQGTGSSAGKYEPRAARSPLLKAQERSPTLELADLIRDTGPVRPAKAATIAPRDATTPRLGAGQKSPSMELAELLRETGPQGEKDAEAEKDNGFTNPFAASGRRHSLAAPEEGKATEMASRRSSLGAGRLMARSPYSGADEIDEPAEAEEDSQQHQQRRKQSLTLAEAIRAGPLEPPASSSSAAVSTGLGISNAVAPGSPGGSSPGNRVSKRWTMSGVGTKLLSRPRSNSQTSLQPASPLLGRAGSGASGRHSQDSRGSQSSPWEMVSDAERGPGGRERPTSQQQQQLLSPSQVASTSAGAVSGSADASRSDGDYKRRPTTSFHRERHEQPYVPQASQIPPEAHPANSSSPLEYVKLARTKGARLLRAAETKKRTYLAVLCGEDGERIELFTGSRSISLSLNRTFVLPETPRTIEFQLQGDDLVDIYLVYQESIFALEPATVRVREVGVGRGERRARRERERRMRNLAATDRAPQPEDPAAADEVRSPALYSALHPADPALHEQQPAEASDSQAEGEDLAVPIVHAQSRSPSPMIAARPRTTSSATTPSEPPPAFPADEYPARLDQGGPPPSAASTTPSAHVHPPSSSRSTKPTIPYSTFQQLPFVPPVPSAVLSSAWTIPPLYTDVVAGSPTPPCLDDFLQPSITVTGAASGVFRGHETSAAEARATTSPADLPLLSPISLLGGAALRQNGPPGLFFVSKGDNLTGIVTADGKSIIKRPLVWSNDKHDPSDPLTDVLQRIEVLVANGTRTVVVKVGSADVKCISVDGFSPASPFSAPLTVSNTLARPAIQFLATHAPSQALFFAQTVGSSSYTIQCLATSSR